MYTVKIAQVNLHGKADKFTCQRFIALPWRKIRKALLSQFVFEWPHGVL